MLDPVMRDLRNWLLEEDTAQARENMREILGLEIQHDEFLFKRLAAKWAREPEREDEFLEYAIDQLERERFPVGIW